MIEDKDASLRHNCMMQNPDLNLDPTINTHDLKLKYFFIIRVHNANSNINLN